MEAREHKLKILLQSVSESLVRAEADTSVKPPNAALMNYKRKFYPTCVITIIAVRGWFSSSSRSPMIREQNTNQPLGK
jgi:hypothetical protein